MSNPNELMPIFSLISIVRIILNCKMKAKSDIRLHYYTSGERENK